MPIALLFLLVMITTPSIGVVVINTTVASGAKVLAVVLVSVLIVSMMALMLGVFVTDVAIV